MNSLELLAATLFSSFVGSMHCVGMCSPFAMLAVGTNKSLGRAAKAARLGAYHFGRLSTYLVMGGTVAILTLPFRQLSLRGSDSAWVSWMIGMVLIGIGTSRLISTLWGNNQAVGHSTWIEKWTRGVISLRRKYSGGPAWIASFLWGFTTTFLPCGWLYLFVLAAAAAPNTGMVFGTMIAFWVGTLPLLSISAWSIQCLQARWQKLSQSIASVCILLFGAYTIVQRGQVDLMPVAHAASNRTSMELIRTAINLELPCCVGTRQVEPMESHEKELGGHRARTP
ncbi:MAG: sulfite exporter TauE/SafE family protein [Pirellula sp.]